MQQLLVKLIIIFMVRAYIITFIYILGVSLLFIAEDCNFDILTLLLLATSGLGTYSLCTYFVEHKN